MYVIYPESMNVLGLETNAFRKCLDLSMYHDKKKARIFIRTYTCNQFNSYTG